MTELSPPSTSFGHVITFFFILGGIGLAVVYGARSLHREEKASTPPRRCQTIPTDVAAWGLSVQSTPAGLYFCYQQGAGQGMTEVVCTPMKECRIP